MYDLRYRFLILTGIGLSGSSSSNPKPCATHAATDIWRLLTLRVLYPQIRNIPQIIGFLNGIYKGSIRDLKGIWVYPAITEVTSNSHNNHNYNRTYIKPHRSSSKP